MSNPTTPGHMNNNTIGLEGPGGSESNAVRNSPLPVAPSFQANSADNAERDGEDAALVHAIDHNNQVPAPFETADDDDDRDFIDQLDQAFHQVGPVVVVLPDFANLDAIADVLATLASEQQLAIRGFFRNMNHAFRELVHNPHRPPFTSEELVAHFGDLQEIDDALEALGSDHRRRLDEFLTDIHLVLVELNARPSRDQQTVHQVSDSLDRLRNDPIESSVASCNSDDQSPKCSICLAHYGPGDANVLLRCHPSHQFHRDCIEVSCFLYLPFAS
ncbi:hypothetical protein MJO29_011845 [Puccinia striiformis f. sp. tritici]|uniref:RING-type domain-containing protein n=1 Tax=Puccinia striiformis f. sp. tritici PST-78 TaxID=1165861 RepID=A0A0L0VZI0_9BASI|nr:hypothetical protein MJO29_011845 [Puccinia striiformis f. sp. tritici]KNF04415.1 hypothetical protein PSTG_02331 [Puccinia striiformis f. sp. tritici PST-78]